MKKSLLISAIAASLLVMPAAAQKKANVLDISKSITDNSIVYPESFETDTQALLEGWYMKNYTATDNRYKTGSGPEYSDEVLIERLRNLPTVIDMPFNQIVRSYIDRYTKNGRSLVTACLGLGNYYLPIIEQALESEGIPNELKYLPMIESAYNPNAVSKAGATGMWQFMLAAANGYDLEVNSLIDERRDPFQSSKKGAKLLHDLYNTYGRWDLAIAAYNCGPGTVNKALRRAGGDPKEHDFWSIYNFLPAETRGYFPMFIAANYIMTYYPDHGIGPVVPTKPLVTDTVGVTTRVNLNQISKVLNIPIDELRLLNPQYRADVVPGSAKKPYMICLPAQQISAYIMSENDIINCDAAKYAQRVTATPGELATTEEFPGTEVENELAELAAIAADDEQALEDELRQMKQSADDVPAIAESADDAPAQQASAATRERRPAGPTRTVSHKVVAGESLKDIATKYSVSVDNIKLWNGLSRDAVRTGQVLQIKTNVAEVAQTKETKTQKTTPQKTATQSATTASAAPAKTTAQEAPKTATSAAKSSSQGKQAMQAKKTAEEQNTASSNSKKSKGNEVASQSNAGKNSKQGNSKKDKNDKNNKKQQAAPSKHEVKNGESLDKIARQNGVTVEELRKANGNLKGDVIHPGDKLNIPKNSKASTKKSSKSGSKSSSKSGKKSGKKKR